MMLTRRIGLLTSTLVGVLVLSPWLWGTGYLLHYDLVFVPHLHLSAGTAGLDGGVPRAVPNDVIAALLNVVFPGWLVERLVLLGFFVALGWGLDRWRSAATARFAAAVALCWNPWVGERLAIGHWGYLWGYAALVWVVVAALDLRARDRDAAPSNSSRTTLVAGLVMGSLSGSTGGVLVAIAALALLAWPGPTRVRARGLILGAFGWCALNAAWWFPFLTLAPSGAADRRGVTAFASRADSSAGLWASLASGGGIWHDASWFASRSNGIVVLLVAAAAVGGIVMCARHSRSGLGNAVPAMAVGGLVLAGAASVPGMRDVVVWVVLHLPGGGLLRDAQKFAALWVVPAGLGIGLGVDAVRRRTQGTLMAPCVLLAACLAPVATLPGLAFAEHGRWSGAHYPGELQAVASQLGRQPDAVAIFPWQLYRQYGWNDNQVVLDPWQRLVPNRVLVDDDLPLSDGVVRGENSDSAAITAALTKDQHNRSKPEAVRALRRAGVRYVVEQKDQPSGRGHAPVAGRVIHSGPLLEVRDLGPVPGDARRAVVPWWAPTGLVASGCGVLGAIGWCFGTRRFGLRRAVVKRRRKTTKQMRAGSHMG